MAETSLLVMSCSARKRAPSSQRRPAVEVYDGPAFQLLRKWAAEWHRYTSSVEAREYGSRLLVVPGLICVIVSARFGPIPWAQPIETYDDRLGRARAEALGASGEWCRVLHEHCRTWGPARAFVFGGAVYKLAVPVTKWRTPNMGVELSSGGIGYQLRQLKQWLEGTKR